MKNLINKIMIFMLMLFNFSCENYVEEVNVNPDTFSDVDPELIIGTPMLATIQLSSSGTARYSAIITDQLSGCDRQFQTLETYSFTASDFDSPWSNIFQEGIIQTKLVRENTNNDALIGISLILESLLFGEATAVWGDIPFSEVGNSEEFPNPKYDSQVDVLNGIQIMLDEAITKVGIEKVTLFGDKAYVTNLATWNKVANSLKARYYLLNKDYTNALKFAKLGISSVDESLLSFHSATDGQKNMYFQFIVEQRGGYLDLCETPTLLEFLNGKKTRSLDTPGNSEILKYYFIEGADDNITYDKDDTINTNDDGVFGQGSPFPIVDFYEIKLIEAEAAHRTDDMSGALKALNDVRKELAKKYDVGQAQFPLSTETGDNLLKQILEEKYIALFGSSQVFHDLRRTNNLIGVSDKSSTTTIPQRYLYPQSEIDANSNFPGQVELTDKLPIYK